MEKWPFAPLTGTTLQQNIGSSLNILADTTWLIANQDAGSLTSTTYLDGLRGWMALVVINFHYLFAFTDVVGIGYGYDEAHRSFWALPGIRLLHDGNLAVMIFFAISGYVCSLKPLRYMDKIYRAKSEHDRILASRELASTFAHSIFRRCFRLYLPALLISLNVAMCAYVGLFEPTRFLLDERKVYFPHGIKFSEPQPKRFTNLTEQFTFWMNDIWSWGNPFNPGPVYPHHDNHLWTIPYEFRLSMHLYLALLSLSWCKPRVRLVYLATLSLLYFCWNHWEGPLFFLGAALAQWNILQVDRTNSNLTQEEQIRQSRSVRRRHRKVLRFFGYILAIYLVSYPALNVKYPAPGYRLVSRMIPSFCSRKERVPKTIGVFILLGQLSTSYDHALSPTPNLMHRLLTCSLARWMGSNMFSLYLVHGTIFHILGYGLPHLWWQHFGNASPAEYVLGVLFGWAVSTSICLFCANWFTRIVDARCARLTKWLEKQSFIKDI